MSGFAPAIRLKQGATFSADIRITDDAGGSVTLSNGMLSMQIADGLNNAVASPTGTLSSDGSYVTFTAGTSGWPVGLLAAQVTVTAGGTSTISETFFIIIEQAIT